MQEDEGGFKKQLLEEEVTQDTKTITSSLCWV